MIFQEVEEKSSAGNGGEGARKEVGEEGRIVKTIVAIVAIIVIVINHRHHRDPLLWHWHLKMLTRTVDLFARQLPKSSERKKRSEKPDFVATGFLKITIF